MRSFILFFLGRKIFRTVPAVLGASCLAVLASPAPSGAEGQRVAVVMSDAGKIYLSILEGLKPSTHVEIKELYLERDGRDEREQTRQALERFRPNAIIGVGEAAVAWAYDVAPRLPSPRDRPVTVVASGIVCQSKSEDFPSVSGVCLDPTAGAYLKFMRDAMPEGKKVGILSNPDLNKGFAKSVQAAGAGQGFEVKSAAVRSHKNLGAALQSLSEWRADILLITYDPLIINRESWQYVVGYAMNNSMALMVPSGALLKSGGLISCEADYAALGRQTMALAVRLMDEDNSKEVLESPAKILRGINMRMANFLKLTVPQALGGQVDLVAE